MGRFRNVFGMAAQRVQAPVWCDEVLTANAAGLSAGQRVATGLGWRPVEAVAVGDPVLTFDHGMQKVTAVTRHIMWMGDSVNKADWPLLVPIGALGNPAPMLVLPGQILMIESDLAEMLYGEPFVTIPALALEGFRGIERHRAHGRVDVVTLSFEAPQLVFTNCGAMFLCEGGDPLSFVQCQPDAYAPLTEAQARELLAEMDWDDVRTPVATSPSVNYGTR